MRLKARGLAQHGGPHGWLEEGNPAGVILYVMGGAVPLSFFKVPVTLIGAAQKMYTFTNICHKLLHAR
jgi:hypothetical protein